MQDDKPQFSQHLSNEQTFLSWVRTGLEVMAFGIVSVKFSGPRILLKLERYDSSKS